MAATMINPCVEYCSAFASSGLTPRDFAFRMLSARPELCLAVLEWIGSFPCSDAELRALQAAFR